MFLRFDSFCQSVASPAIRARVRSISLSASIHCLRRSQWRNSASCEARKFRVARAVKRVAVKSVNGWRPIEIEEPIDNQIIKTTRAGRCTTGSAQSWRQAGGEALVSRVQVTHLRVRW